MEAGADLDAKTDEGCSPLAGAARNGHVEAVRFLLREGADVTATTNDGKNPLDVAESFERDEVAALLRSHIVN